MSTQMSPLLGIRAIWAGADTWNLLVDPVGTVPNKGLAYLGVEDYNVF